MAVLIVSDLHGAADALRKAVPEGSTLVLLGDLVNFLDYTSRSGILTEVFDKATIGEVVRLRTEGKPGDAKRLLDAVSNGREEHIGSAIRRRVAEQYEAVFAALPNPTYMILGNVDSPGAAHQLAEETPAVREADGRVFEIEGERFGFSGGALPTPLGIPSEVTEEEMKRKLEGLGPVDVLCSHIPPAVPELCFDTRANRLERGSRDILSYIREVQPRRAYFGHVHQPLVSALHVGSTLCVNVGYFRATRRAWPHHANG
ncbi:MAG: metallophosphoesterase family protein [Actinobacteria bacterium]|nr:metallophosphoesterase family protein [Actinomycetota bacterium]